MKRKLVNDNEMLVKQEIIENVINAILSRDTTAMDASAAELKTLLDRYREQN